MIDLARIEDGHIIIRIAVSHLPIVVEGAWAAGYMDKRFKVTNADEFAAELVRELNRESEDGTTRIHKLFDGAINEAIDQGAFGIEEHENQEARSHDHRLCLRARAPGNLQCWQ